MIRGFSTFFCIALTFTALAISACNDGSSNPTPSNSVTGSGGGGSTGPIGPPEVVTYHNDLARTGQNLTETTLTRSNVNSTSFGKIGAIPVDGLVYAQPLYVPGVSIGGGVHDVLYVATEHDSVYAFDADSLSSTPLWHRNFVSDCLTSPSTPSNCSTATVTDVNAPNVNPEIGITSTPVIDPTAGVIYVAAFTKESGTFYWRVHAMNIQTGAEMPGSPITVDANYPGTGSGVFSDGLIYFNPIRQLQRAGLVLSNGLLYVAFSSFDDQENDHGWMMAYNASSLDPVSVWMTTPDSGGGTVWMAGDAPAVDSSGNIYVATGNADNATYPNYNIPADLGDAVIKLSFGAQGFDLADYFVPYNYQALDSGDVEMGSGGVMLLPDQPTGIPHLLLTGGKEGTLYLLNRDNLGKLNTTPGATSDTQIVQEIPGVPGGAPGNATGIPGGSDSTGLFSTAAYFNGAVFVAAVADDLRKIPIANGLLDWASMTSTNNTIKYRGATPSISADGTANGIVWYLDASAYSYSVPNNSPVPQTLTFGPAVLYAYSTDDLSTPLYASNQVASDAAGCPTSAANTPGSGAGCAVKFAVPTVINGKVFVGTDTEISVYGLRSSVTAMNFKHQADRAIASTRQVITQTTAADFPIRFFGERENSCQLHPEARASGALF